jgi:hypothetical protein
MKARTAATLITDHKREAVAGRIPYFDVLDGSDDAMELHGASQKSLAPKDAEQRLGPGPGLWAQPSPNQVTELRRLCDRSIRFVIPKNLLLGRAYLRGAFGLFPLRAMRSGNERPWRPNINSRIARFS